MWFSFAHRGLQREPYVPFFTIHNTLGLGLVYNEATRSPHLETHLSRRDIFFFATDTPSLVLS